MPCLGQHRPPPLAEGHIPSGIPVLFSGHTKQESYERILLEKTAAAATLANEERAGRLKIWSWKAEAAQRWEAGKAAQRKKADQKDPLE